MSKMHAFCGLEGCKNLSENQKRTSPLGLQFAVGLNARCRNLGDDVRKVQNALNSIPKHEGGTKTETGEGELVPDGLIGNLTSKAIFNYQAKLGLTKDGIVDVGMATDRSLAGLKSTYGSLTKEMLEHTVQVSSILELTRSAIASAVAYKNNPPSASSGPFPSLGQMGKTQWEKMVKHFQIDKFPNWRTEAQNISSLYMDMKMAVGHIPQGMILIADEPDSSSEGAFAFTFAGGYQLAERNKTWNGIPRGTIYLCPLMHKLDRDAFSYVLIHELAHFVGPVSETSVQIDDYAYRHSKGSRYDQLLPWQRTHNADSYAQFAFDVIGRPFDLHAHLSS
jgi:peptidoglycan hydrolase-like protein with peptidoglycan-binding domain